MRSGILLLSCVLHAAAASVALGVGVYAERRPAMPAPRVEIAASEPQAPSSSVPAAEPVVVVEEVVDALVTAGEEFEVDVAPVLAEDREPPRAAFAPSLQRVVLPQKALVAAPPSPTPLQPNDAPPPAPSAGAVPQDEVMAEPCADNEPPRYPDEERRRGHEGRVVVAVAVDAHGRVQQATLAQPSPYPGLNREALRAVRQWRFQPARRHGVPIAADTEVAVHFRLRDSARN